MIRLMIGADLKAEARLVLDADQTRYLTSVMRLEDGDALLVFNGRDGEWRAVLDGGGRKARELRIQEKTRDQPPASGLELIMALVKRARLETIIEKASELGAGRVRLAITRRTNADHTNVSRLCAIAIEAAEQCERLDAPEVLAPLKLDAILAALPADRRIVFCDESAASGPLQGPVETLQGIATAAASVLIGPEGGFAPEERARLLADPRVTAISLGPRVLRADTAAIAALSLWQATRGDWRSS